MATYRNPWHNAKNNTYGPAVYETSAEPVQYGGYQLYMRVQGRPGACGVDVVREGVCVTQMAGMNGARRSVDRLNAAAESLAA